EFVGNAFFLPGTGHGRSAECILGTLELLNEARGNVDLLIRPENVTLWPAAAGSGSRVRQILFFGHDQLVTVQLPSGALIEARLGPMYNFAIGQQVTIRVEAPVVAYPRLHSSVSSI